VIQNIHEQTTPVTPASYSLRLLLGRYPPQETEFIELDDLPASFAAVIDQGRTLRAEAAMKTPDAWRKDRYPHGHGWSRQFIGTAG
jgi:hypothetical protein